MLAFHLLLLVLYLLGLWGQLSCLLAMSLECSVGWWRKKALLIMFSLAISNAIFCAVGLLGSVLSVLHHIGVVVNSWFWWPTTSGAMGGLMNYTYAVFSFHLLIMAVNCYLAVCRPLYYRRQLRTSIVCRWIAAAWLGAGVYASLRLFPCCRLEWDLELSNVNTEHGANNASFYVDSALSAIGCIVSTVLFVIVGRRLADAHNRPGNTGSTPIQHRRLDLLRRTRTDASMDTTTTDDPMAQQTPADGCVRRRQRTAQNTRLTAQFLLILVIYLVLSVNFTVGGLMQGRWSLKYVNSIMSAVNFGANPVIYLLFNRELRTALRRLYRLQPTITTMTTTSALPMV